MFGMTLPCGIACLEAEPPGNWKPDFTLVELSLVDVPMRWADLVVEPVAGAACVLVAFSGNPK